MPLSLSANFEWIAGSTVSLPRKSPEFRAELRLLARRGPGGEGGQFERSALVENQTARVHSLWKAILST
jgi:hypothetical protein